MPYYLGVGLIVLALRFYTCPRRCYPRACASFTTLTFCVVEFCASSTPLFFACWRLVHHSLPSLWLRFPMYHHESALRSWLRLSYGRQRDVLGCAGLPFRYPCVLLDASHILEQHVSWPRFCIPILYKFPWQRPWYHRNCINFSVSVFPLEFISALKLMTVN